MFLGLFFILLAYACLRGLSTDRQMLAMVVLVGFLQDPARKLIAGEPVIMTVLVGVVIGCMVLRQLLISRQSFLDPFTRWTDTINPALKLYVLLVVAQGFHSLIRYGSPIVPALGAIFYLAPLVAIGLGYSQFGRFEVVRQFLTIFCCLALLVAITVIASFFGFDSAVFGEVGSGLVIYDQGTILKAYSGLMRSSEIASWHMGACVCFLIILVADKGTTPAAVVAALAVFLLMSSIVLTGRRKMILQILIFSSLYFPVLRYYQGRLSSRFISISALGISFVLVAYWFLPSFEGTQYDLYVARSVSVFEDAGDRFASLGIGSVGWAYRDYGFFGGGLGVAAQGAQHFASGGIASSGASEGGIGKLVSELGILSLFVIVWLAYTFSMYLHNCLKLVAEAAPNKLILVVGVLAFIIANVPTFIVASQVYGDMFIILVMGLLTGALFAIPNQITQQLSIAPRRHS